MKPWPRRQAVVLLAALAVLLVACDGTGATDGGFPAHSTVGATDQGSVAGGAFMDRAGPARTGDYPGGGPTRKPHPLWTFTAGGNVCTTPAVADGIVYVGSDDHFVYALDARSGALRWKFQTGHIVQSGPAVSEGTVYVGGADGYLYALDASNGQLAWKFGTGRTIYSSPAIVSGVLYVGSADHYLYALDSRSGAERWRFETQGVVFSSPAVDQGTVYFGSGGADSSLYAVDAATGRQRWRVKATGEVVTTPAVFGRAVYFTARDGPLYAVDVQTGRQKWTVPGLVGSPTLAGGSIVAAGWVEDSGTFYGIAPRVVGLGVRDGTERWTFRLKGDEPVGSQSASNSLVYFGRMGRGGPVKGRQVMGASTPSISRPAERSGGGRWMFRTAHSGSRSPRGWPTSVVVRTSTR